METKDAVVINPNSENEFDYLDLETGNEQTYTYTGDAGLVLNFFDRIILGIKEGDLKLAFSGSVNDESRIITNRNILDRAKQSCHI